MQTHTRLPQRIAVVGTSGSGKTTLARLARRTAKRLIADEQVCGNNHERLRKTLSRESIILWAFQSHWKNRRRYLSLTADPERGTLRVVRLRSPRETEQFVQALAGIVE